MAKNLKDSKSSIIFRLLLVSLPLFHLFPESLSEIPFQELETAVDALRSRGYNLFGNSIIVSDLLYQILSGENFTLLSPPDSALFSLDMSTDAVHYVHSLRSHLLPRRLSLSDLRTIALCPTPYVDTLVPQHLLFLSHRRGDVGFGIEDAAAATSAGGFEYITVDGVRISNPDVYIGDHVAVHGLDGAVSATVPPPESIHDAGLGYAMPPVPPVRSVPPPSDSHVNVDAGAPHAIGIPHVSMSPGSVGGDVWFLAPSNVHWDSRPSPPPGLVPGFTAAAPSHSGVRPVLAPMSSHQILPLSPPGAPPIAEASISTISPRPDVEHIEPVASSAAIPPPQSVNVWNSPPFDLDSILPLNRPLISPEISIPPSPRTLPSEPLEIVGRSNRSKKHEGSEENGEKNGQEDKRDAPRDSGPKGVAGTSPHQFGPPQLIRPEVSSAPAMGVLPVPVPEIPERYIPPWDSWTELIRDNAPAAVQSAGALDGKRSNMGMKGVQDNDKHGVRVQMEDDYEYGVEDFDPEDLSSILHT